MIKKSFTLIEILIVISILVIFSGILLASYNNFTQIKTLEQEVNHLVDILSLAKGKTQAGDIEFDCTGMEEFGGYRVEISDTDYGLQQCCRDTLTKSISSCGQYLNIYKFPSYISNLTGPINLDFAPLTGGVNESTLTLKNRYIDKCIDISIFST